MTLTDESGYNCTNCELFFALCDESTCVELTVWWTVRMMNRPWWVDLWWIDLWWIDRKSLGNIKGIFLFAGNSSSAEVTTSNFARVTFTLYMRRKPLYYIMNVFIPCCLLSFIAVITFILPPNCVSRLGLSMYTYVYAIMHTCIIVVVVIIIILITTLYRAKRSTARYCHDKLSVSLPPSVCDVGGLWSHALEFLGWVCRGGGIPLHQGRGLGGGCTLSPDFFCRFSISNRRNLVQTVLLVQFT